MYVCDQLKSKIHIHKFSFQSQFSDKLNFITNRKYTTPINPMDLKQINPSKKKKNPMVLQGKAPSSNFS